MSAEYVLYITLLTMFGIAGYYCFISVLEKIKQKKYLERKEPPSLLRPAKPGDIKKGCVLWYPEFTGNGQRFCKIIDVVLRPDSQFKAFIAHDGCCHGLNGAFVEV